MDADKLKEIILREIEKHRKIGDQVGGSGHMGHVRITGMEIIKLTDVEFGDKRARKVVFAFKTYTETEFEHPPEMDVLYESSYTDRLIVDDDLNVLDYEKDAS